MNVGEKQSLLIAPKTATGRRHQKHGSLSTPADNLFSSYIFIYISHPLKHVIHKRCTRIV